MEKIALLTITLLAIYYIYRTTFKELSCNCSGKGCCNNKSVKKKNA